MMGLCCCDDDCFFSGAGKNKQKKQQRRDELGDVEIGLRKREGERVRGGAAQRAKVVDPLSNLEGNSGRRERRRSHAQDLPQAQPKWAEERKDSSTLREVSLSSNKQPSVVLEGFV